MRYKIQSLKSWKLKEKPFWPLFLGFWLFVFLPLMSGCSWFFDEDKAETEEKMTLGFLRIPYKASIHPKISDEFVPREIEERLKAVSSLIKLESRPPTSLRVLQHRIRTDVARLKRALAEKGYFDGQVESSVVRGASPIIVTLAYTLGKRYKVSKVSVVMAQGATGPLPLTLDRAAKEIRIDPGDEVDLARVQEANHRLAKYLRDHGYPYGVMEEPEGQIDHHTKRVHITFRIQPGTQGVFGNVEVAELENLDPQFIRNRLTWKEGSRFDERQLDKTRRQLMGTGLFSTIEVKSDDNAPVPQDVPVNVPISVKATEGPPRTIGAGVKYATTEGIGGQAFWTHYNAFGFGQKLGAMLHVSPRLSKAKVDLDIPDIFAPKQQLRHEVSVIRERNRAYANRSFDIGVHLEHPFTDRVKSIIGVVGESGKSTRSGVTYLNRLVSFPVELLIDASDDLIDPTKGGRLAAQITPYLGQSGKDSKLVVSTVRGSYYLRVAKSDAVVIAGWVHMGTITVSSLDNLAPNKRFYAGGLVLCGLTVINY